MSNEESIWEVHGITLTSVLYGTTYPGVSAYAIPLEPTPWTPPNPFEPKPCPPYIPGPTIVIPQPEEPSDTADSLLDRCKRRLAEIERLIAQRKDLEVEAETLRKMIKATEKAQK
jgi:hypothetical protein